jgi:hypothetical protein
MYRFQADLVEFCRFRLMVFEKIIFHSVFAPRRGDRS